MAEGSLPQFQTECLESGLVDERAGEIVAERDFLHPDKVALGNARRRIIVGIVGIRRVGVVAVLSRTGDDGNVGVLLVARHHPSVLELLGHSYLLAGHSGRLSDTCGYS